MIEAILLTCITLVAIDGDSIRCNGINMRDMGDGEPFVSGYDTPEIWSNKCPKELELARIAKKRMEVLLSQKGVQIFYSGQRDETERQRPLVWVKLVDGKTIGSILISEGLARKWTPDYDADWCG